LSTVRHHDNSQSGSVLNALFNSIALVLFQVPWWLAMLTLVIIGPLLGYYSVAAALIIVGSVVSMTITSFGSSWRGVIWIPQDVPCAILAVAVAQMIAASSADTPVGGLFLTVVLFIAMSTVLTGVLFYFLGYFRLGNLVRFLPFPVVAGFLGGTGWLLLKAGVDVSLGEQLAGQYLKINAMLHWTPALMLALLIWWLGTFLDSPLVLPVVVAIAIVAFHLLVDRYGMTIDDMMQAGWMFTTQSAQTSDAVQHRLGWSDIVAIDWGLLVAHSGALPVLAFGSVISMMLNNSGFELQVNDDFDVNRDLRVAGIANIGSGLIGGWPGYMSPASSWINARQRQQLPVSGLLVAVGIGLIVLLALPLLSQVPLFVMGAVVAYIGVLFLVEWVIDSYRRLSRNEYLIVLAIVAGIAVFGLAQGVILGLLLALALFLVTFSRLDVVRHQLTGEHVRSRVKRSSEQRDFLHTHGSETLLFQLQGYLFFGTANRLLEQVRSGTGDTDTRYIVLDFERVSGVDSTAVSVFLKLYRDAAKSRSMLVLVSLDQATHELLNQQLSDGDSLLRYFDSLDAAMEWVEQKQLSAGNLQSGSAGPELRAYLQPLVDDVDGFLKQLEKLQLDAGDYLIRQRETATEIFFIDQGSVTAQLEKLASWRFIWATDALPPLYATIESPPIG